MTRMPDAPTLIPDAPTLIEEKAVPEADLGCCEPECGPDTCGDEATVDVSPVRERIELQGCCEPECGPDTCGC